MRGAVLFAGVGVLLTLAGPAAADRLDAQACDALHAEQGKLVDAGTRNDMKQGPEWAKSNLPPARLARIRQLIEVEEQIAFRCQAPRAAAAAAKATAPAAAEASAGEPEAQPPRKSRKKGRHAKAEAGEAAGANVEKPAEAAETPADKPKGKKGKGKRTAKAAPGTAAEGAAAQPAADSQTKAQ